MTVFQLIQNNYALSINYFDYPLDYPIKLMKLAIYSNQRPFNV